MKRFAQSYLTISVVLIIIVNLALVILYGRQFLFQAAVETCNQSSCLLNQNNEFGTTLVMINFLIVSVQILIWLGARRAYLTHQENSETIDTSGEQTNHMLG